MSDILTERLRLSPVCLAEADTVADLVRINRDPAVWTHFVRGRPVSDEVMRDRLVGDAQAWETNGLDWWVVRLLAPLGGAGAGEVVGMGGVSLARLGVDVWNLGFRLTPAVWGYGLATEIARAGLVAARQARPGIPVTARVLERNQASWRVLDKVLTLAWQGVAPTADPDIADLPRRVYSDRELEPDLLAAIIALG